MFEMSIGIMKAESRSGPRSSRTVHCSETVCRPPMPEPMNTPISSRLTRFKVQTRIAQGLPAGINAELGKAVRAPDLLGRGKRGAWVEILDLGGDLANRYCEGSKRAILAMPHWPASRFCQKASTWWPKGVTTPRPVMTTRRSVQLLAIKSNGAAQADASPSYPGIAQLTVTSAASLRCT